LFNFPKHCYFPIHTATKISNLLIPSEQLNPTNKVNVFQTFIMKNAEGEVCVCATYCVCSRSARVKSSRRRRWFLF